MGFFPTLRFGDGYSIKVCLNKETSYQNAILDCLQLHFPGTQFKVSHKCCSALTGIVVQTSCLGGRIKYRLIKC